jgi:hypothetical protein
MTGRIWTSVAFSLGMAVAGVSNGALIAADDLESYSVGSLNNGSGGTGWTSNWTSISGMNVASPGIDGARTGQINAAADNVVAATRGFATQTGTVYFSVRFRPVSGLEVSDFIHFYIGSSSTSNANSGGFGIISTETNRLGARVGGTNGGDTTSSSISAVQGESYLLVGKLMKEASANYNRIHLFVNPVGATEPAVPDANDFASAGIGSVNRFNIRTFNLDSGDVYQFDSIRIGTTFSDVIPEPATVGLLALAIPLTRRRR